MENKQSFQSKYVFSSHYLQIIIINNWSQFLFGSWRNNLNQVTQGCVQPDWGYFEWTEQIISIIPYKLIQTFLAMILKNIFIFSK